MKKTDFVGKSFFPTHFTQHFMHINSTYAKCDESIVYLSFLIKETFFPPIFIISFRLLLLLYAIQKQRAENEQISNFLRAIVVCVCVSAPPSLTQRSDASQ